MVDATINDNVQVQDERIDKLTAQIEKLTAGLQAFASGVVSTLSGVPQTAPAARRRGRPPGSPNKPKQVATSQTAPTVAERPPHPLMIQAVELVTRAGRMTQTDLSKALKIERSHVAHHMRTAVGKGLVHARKVYPKGQKDEVVFYNPKWAHFKDQ